MAQDVEEVVMESTAQYWRPACDALGAATVLNPVYRQLVRMAGVNASHRSPKGSDTPLGEEIFRHREHSGRSDGGARRRD